MTANTLRKYTWTPTPGQLEAANVVRLAHRLGCESFAELQRFSVDEPERFWPAVVGDLEIEFSAPWTRVLDDSDGIEWTRWFVGGRINVARVCVHRWAESALADEEAAVWRAEDGERRSLTW